jgi:hypothetical protein
MFIGQGAGGGSKGAGGGGARKGRREGMAQKEQKAVLADFRAGAFNVLVATCIGEEGLDIPQVHALGLTGFYLSLPSRWPPASARRAWTSRRWRARVSLTSTWHGHTPALLHIAQSGCFPSKASSIPLDANARIDRQCK